MNDVKSNIKVLEGHDPASISGASLVGSDVVDMGDYLDGIFIAHVGTIGSGVTLAGKLQYSSSATFASDVNDDTGTTGNTAAVTELSDGINLFHVVQPVDPDKPYYRLALTDAGGAVVYSSEFIGRAKVTPVTYA